MTTAPEVTYDEFRAQWLEGVTEGDPSTVELGRRFAQKLLMDWLDTDVAPGDMVYCDGSGDGGIDVAYLDRGEAADDLDSGETGDTWYLVQSKYGSAFRGPTTLLEEGQKIVNTLDGKQAHLSSLTRDLLERLKVFLTKASDQDRIILLFATVDSLTEDENQALRDIRSMGRERIGHFIDVQAISIETIYQRNLEEAALLPDAVRVPIEGKMAQTDGELLVGVVTLIDLFKFLKNYRDKTNELDQIYDRNVRRFLGGGRKVNKGIQKTLREEPERFGLYNNGITIVVTDYNQSEDGTLELVDPYIVNGCQTTRTIWDVCYQRLESGGQGVSAELEGWKTRASKGVVVTKIARVGVDGDILERDVTRFTNSQNAVREQDFLTLTRDFRDWAREMEHRYGVYLEIQRGGWESRRALQKQRPGMRQLSEHANAFDLVKVFGAGWLGEAGAAFGKNAPFLPNGTIYKRIMEPTESDVSFGVDDFYAAYLLQCAANASGFGRGSQVTRRQTRFLFYMVVMELVSEVVSRMGLQSTKAIKSQALTKILTATLDKITDSPLIVNALECIDTYMTEGSDNSVFGEPAYSNVFNNDLNGFLKWDKLGKSDEYSPRLRMQLQITKMLIGTSGARNEMIEMVSKGTEC